MPQATESAAMPWLRRLGVTTPELVVVTDERILAPHEPTFGPPWVVKPDIVGGGKGPAGLVHICRSSDELSAAVAATLRSGTPAVVEEYVEGANAASPSRSTRFRTAPSCGRALPAESDSTRIRRLR